MTSRKAVFHIDRDETYIFELMIANIRNFLADVGNADIAVVANGPAVKLFVESSNKRFEEELRSFSEKGVRFYICENSLKYHRIDRQDLFRFCEIVPAGITKIVALQEDGYAYIKP
ncbi:MAG: DsrE family protein [Candidatus Methanodesulfokora washburnensis]|jgi:intracellular sulfur oxidation DsrE/DsrF family protein